MIKRGVSILFTVLFLLFTVTPTVLLFLDETQKVSMVYPDAEELENEKLFDADVFFSSEKANNSCLVFTVANSGLGYVLTRYATPHLNILSPPPDFQLV